jgi:hypothetical protein
MKIIDFEHHLFTPEQLEKRGPKVVGMDEGF